MAGNEAISEPPPGATYFHRTPAAPASANDRRQCEPPARGVDMPPLPRDRSGMANAKLSASRPRPSRGTVIAEKCRARLNTATDAQRAALFAKGMQLIYGSGHAPKSPVGSR